MRHSEGWQEWRHRGHRKWLVRTFVQEMDHCDSLRSEGGVSIHVEEAELNPPEGCTYLKCCCCCSVAGVGALPSQCTSTLQPMNGIRRVKMPRDLCAQRGSEGSLEEAPCHDRRRFIPPVAMSKDIDQQIPKLNGSIDPPFAGLEQWHAGRRPQASIPQEEWTLSCSEV